MKTPVTNAWAFAGAVAISLACSPLAFAQSSNPSADTTQNSKTTDSTADQNSATTGAPGTGAGTLDKTSSKSTTNSLDMNPSMAPTGSADQSGTKNPSDQTSKMDTESSHSGKTSDREFMLKAAQGGMTEVAMGKLAQDKGSSSDVKEFGSHMVMDHSKANDKLKAIAAKKGVTLPSDLDAKHQAMVDRLQNMSGAAFDHAYVKAMVKAHEKDAAEFSDASDSAHDPALKDFAGDTLKMIKSHLADIKSIQSKMK